MQRHWTTNVSDPFDVVGWVTTHIKLTNWKTGEVVYENDVEHPADWAQSAIEMCASKYFRKADIPKIGGEHSIKQLAARVANDLVQHGKKRGYFNNEEAIIFRDEIIAGFITQRIGFNSPVWFNFGLFNEYGIEGTKGRDRFFVNPETNEIEQLDRELIRPGGAACFLTRVTDSLFSDSGDGMFDWIATQTKVFLTGAGDGANVSNIRGVGEPISGGGVSAGLPAFLPVRDQGSGYIKSGGKTRRSATMLVCDLDHPDIEWYINWKRHEEAKAQALIAMGYDADYEGEAYGTVSGQNSNNSVRVPNSFMKSLHQDGFWHLLSRCNYDRFPDASSNLTEGGEHPQGTILYLDGVAVAIRGKNGVKKIMKAVKATDLWSQITESAWFCGCPGIHFEDTINQWNTMPHYGEIRTSNPCSEVFQPDNTTCNLCSVNLIKFFADLRNPDWIGFEHASRLVTIALDLVVDISSYPTPQHARGAWNIRSIGANHGNIGAVLMRNALPYDSHEGRAVMSMITNVMTLFCWQQSNELGEKLGIYPAYNRDNHRKILAMHWDALSSDEVVARYQGILVGFDLERVKESWERLASCTVFRNSNVTCLVPQGTIGLVLGQDTTGCEPDFALKKSKKCVGGTYMDFVNTSVEPALERLGYDAERTRLVKAYVMKYGAVENCPYIEESHLPVFDTAVRQKTCLDAIAYIVRNLEEEEAELVFNAAGNENDPFKIKNSLLAAREDEEEWEELFEDLEAVSEINEIIKNCTSMDQVRSALAEYEYDLYSVLPCVQIFTRVISHNGHIDALGAFQPHISMGISKCVTGDTLIHTDKGFIEIGSLHEGSQKEDSFVPLEMEVMTKDGHAKTDSFYYGGKKRVLRIELSNGQTITATPNHPIFASVEGGEEDPAWHNTENISPGDYVAIDIGRDIWASCFVDTASFAPTPRYNAQKVCTVPGVVDEKVGWLLGVFASEGHHVRSNWTIGFTNNNDLVLEKLVMILQERFGLKTKIERDYRNDVGYVKVASKTLYEFFSWCGALGTAADKQVPWVILQSPREVVIQFISGLWLDGFVPKAVASACITLKSKKMIDHLQILLHNFGIRCARQIKNGDQYGPFFHLMTASRESFEKFAEIIPLNDDWKVAQIRQHLAQKKSDMARYSSDFVPNSVRCDAATAYGTIHELDSKTKVFGTLVREATARCSWQVADEALKAAGREGLGTTHWSQVTSIIEDEEEVYDVSVPGHRSFIGNGIVCHNTVNMNHDVSIGDVAKAYERAFEKGCKCIAIYRDDSKKSQPLNTGTNKGKSKGKKAAEKPVEVVSFEESIDAYLKTPEGLQEALKRVVKNPELAAMVPPTRREPSLHTSVGDRFRFTLPHQGESIGVFIRFNCWEGTNDIMEVFIDLGKEGDTISGLIDSMARMISLGLQFGIPPKTIGDMLEGMNFGPNGFLGKSSVFGIRSVKSVPDLVGKLLKILPEYYALGRPEAMLHPKPYSPQDPPPNYEAVRQAGLIAKSNGNGHSENGVGSVRRSLIGGTVPSSVARSLFSVEALPQGATAVAVKPETEITTPQEARLKGFTGSTCKKCGSLRTSGTGSCFQCLDCGEYNGPCGG